MKQQRLTINYAMMKIYGYWDRRKIMFKHSVQSHESLRDQIHIDLRHLDSKNANGNTTGKERGRSCYLGISPSHTTAYSTLISRVSPNVSAHEALPNPLTFQPLPYYNFLRDSSLNCILVSTHSCSQSRSTRFMNMQGKNRS